MSPRPQKIAEHTRVAISLQLPGPGEALFSAPTRLRPQSQGPSVTQLPDL